MDPAAPPTTGDRTPTSAEPAPVQVVPLTADDTLRVLAVDQAAFFFDPDGTVPARDTAHFVWPRTFGAVRGQTGSAQEPLAGTYTSYPMVVTVPGPLGSLRRVPMAGLSWVSVHPDERRRGVLRAMLTHHFARLHDAGELLGGLHAAEVGIYGRFGYAVASLEVSLTLDRGTAFLAPELDEAAAGVQTRFVAVDADPPALRRLQDVHARAAAVGPGVVTRADDYVQAVLVDRPERRRGREPDQLLFAYAGSGTVSTGEPTGYAIFHRTQQWEAGQPRGTLKVLEMAAVDAPSLLAMARRLVDFDLVASTTFHARGVEDPLVWWTGSPRGGGLAVRDGLWLRLVDVDLALAARGYSAACDVVLDVRDDVCPWNQGRWHLQVDSTGSARCERTDADAEVRLPVQALGAAYLGSRTLAAQRMAGTVQELRPGSLWPLSRAMSDDREPLGAVDF